MGTIKVIFNPASNRGHNLHLAEHFRAIVGHHAEAEWVATEAPGHAVKLAQEAAAQGCARIVAIGGDGTVHEVVNGLMCCEQVARPCLAIVPVGSGNDFVRGARAILDPEQAFKRALLSEDKGVMDVGTLGINGESLRYWMNALGIGFDAAVTAQSLRIRRIHGSAMYFIAAIRTIIENYDAPAMEVEIDGVLYSQQVQMLTIGNGVREGGGFITTPDSRIDDGVLDFAMFQPVSRPMMIRLIPEVMRGTHGRFKQVRMGRFRSMKLRADRAFPIHSDGEMMAMLADNAREIEVGIVPAAIKLII